MLPQGETERSKVAIRKNLRNKMAEKKNRRWDKWICRVPNPEDQTKLITLFRKSKCNTKSDFMRTQLLEESFKVVTVDSSLVDYLNKLDELIVAVNKTGVLYNQSVKAMHKHHSEKVASRLLAQTEQYQAVIAKLVDQAVSLTKDLRDGGRSVLSEKPI